MFNTCEFIMGENGSIVIVVPDRLPKDMPVTIQVKAKKISFRVGEEVLADIPCSRLDILQRIVSKAKIGIIEFLQGAPKFPAYISAVANVEVVSEAA